MGLKTETQSNKVSLKGSRRPATPALARPGVPLYLQLVGALKEEIVSGVHPIGAQLPTEEELCGRFSVSRYTVREALRRLREDGLVSSRQGAGTTVVPPRPADSFVHEVTSINDLVAFATDVRFVVDTIEMVRIDRNLSLRTGIASGEEWLVVKGLRHAAERGEPPVCWTEVCINREFAAVGRLVPRHRGPIFHLIEDLFGQNIAEVHQEIAAASILPNLAAELKVKAGSMALEVQRTYRLATGKIAQVSINTHPASSFRHVMTMRRVKG